MFLDPQRYWPELCQRLGHPELIDDPRFATIDQRAKNGLELYDLLAGFFKGKTAREWGEAFTGWDAPWEFIQSISEVAADPQAHANGYLFDVEVMDGTKVTLVTGPITVDGSAIPANPRRAPLKGEHTSELLSGLGLNAADVDRLRSQGIVAQETPKAS
jgi:crotonobetainyl-CoA:carnitine CoA-transferase CaiB-like acyl-CoA transferase